MEKNIHTIDLNFMGMPGTIASYLIPHENGVALVESGPGSTIAGLTDGIKALGYTVPDVTDVLLTHIHLDHAGASGWLASQGAQIYVHEVGAPHMLNPEKLLASAGRIYGDMMDTLWGEFLPVPKAKLTVVKDGDVVEIGDLSFKALYTPGHAYHHLAYIFQDVCFSGDVGGVRIGGYRHIRVPMPPPEFNLELWRESLALLRQQDFQRIAPTHFGIYDDPDWHLDALDRALDEVEEWMEAVMPEDPPIEVLNDRFLNWSRERSISDGLEERAIELYEAANPSWMSPYGMQRYWSKYRAHEN